MLRNSLHLFLCWIFIATFGQTVYATIPISAIKEPAQNHTALEISLLTFGPGQEYWERFGHNAILIRDRDTGEAISYNYGIFDFDQEDFFLNFLRGHMRYMMAARPAAADIADYVAENRWIVQQKLNLSAAQADHLRDYLEWNRQPENAQYNYDYFRKNCSTRIRDVVNLALDDALHLQLASPSRGFTYRMHALRLMQPEFWLMLGMDIGLAGSADRRISFWDESFVPMELMRTIRTVTVLDATDQRQALVARETRLANSTLADPSNYPPNWLWRFLVLGIGLASLVILLARQRKYSLARILLATFATLSMLVLGVAGLVLLGLWCLTDHQIAWRNENLLLFNPLCVLLIPTWLGAFSKSWLPSTFARGLIWSIALIAGVACFVKVLPWFTQDNLNWIALLLPLHIAFAYALQHLPRVTTPLRNNHYESV